MKIIFILYLVNKLQIQQLCISYGAFCNLEEQMPLPHLIVILPCILSVLGLLLEIANLCLLCSIKHQARTILNFFLGKFEI
jgi:hypothetical protein